jgi:hypothetical protein
MDGYDIIPIETSSTGSNTSKMHGTSHTTSNTNTVGGEVGIEAQTKVGGSLLGPKAEFSTKVSAKASYSHTWVSTDVESDSETTGTTSSVTVDPSKAAKMKLRLYFENVGSSAARDVTPTFTLSIGERTIATIKPSQSAQMLNRQGRPRSRYPETGAIVVGDRPEDEIILSLEEVEALREGALMRLEVTQVSAKMSRWNSSTNSWDYDADWVNYVEEIDEVTAPLLVRNGDTGSSQYWIYAGSEYDASELRLADGAALVLPTSTNEQGERLFQDVPANEWAYAVSPDPGLKTTDDALATRFDRDGFYLMLLPDASPGPTIQWAELSADGQNVRVSIDPGDFPVASVTAKVDIGDEQVEVKLSDEGAAFYTSPAPFSAAATRVEVTVTDVAGHAQQREADPFDLAL